MFGGEEVEMAHRDKHDRIRGSRRIWITSVRKDDMNEAAGALLDLVQAQNEADAQAQAAAEAKSSGDQKQADENDDKNDEEVA
jgi:hypothetical protein